MVDEHLSGGEDVIPHTQGVEAVGWGSVLPVYHAFNNFLHLLIRAFLAFVEVLDEPKELFHLVDFLDSLDQKVLGDLAELGEILPLSQEFLRLPLDVDPRPVVVKWS